MLRSVGLTVTLPPSYLPNLQFTSVAVVLDPHRVAEMKGVGITGQPTRIARAVGHQSWAGVSVRKSACVATIYAVEDFGCARIGKYTEYIKGGSFQDFQLPTASLVFFCFLSTFLAVEGKRLRSWKAAIAREGCRDPLFA